MKLCIQATACFIDWRYKRSIHVQQLVSSGSKPRAKDNALPAASHLGSIRVCRVRFSLLRLSLFVCLVYFVVHLLVAVTEELI
jgi:hypothetical protein